MSTTPTPPDNNNPQGADVTIPAPAALVPRRPEPAGGGPYSITTTPH